jgi:outer membrane protein OmpA-like peptidoglycan-associated protein
MNVLQKMKGDAQPLPPLAPKKSIALAGLGGIIAISLLGLLGATTQTALVLGSFGASCVLLFGFPDTPFSQPRNIVAGHFLSSLIGLAFLNLLGPSWWAMGLAAGTAISVMMVTRTVHPPAGSNPVIVFLSQPGWGFLLFPTLLGAGVLVLVGLLFLNSTRAARYPKYWLGGPFEPLYRLGTWKTIYAPLTAGVLVSAVLAGGLMWNFGRDLAWNRTDLPPQKAAASTSTSAAPLQAQSDANLARDQAVNPPPAKETAVIETREPENASIFAVSALGADSELFKKKLPSGVELEISRFGAENQLLEFLENKSPGKTSEVELDQVSFDTSKAMLQARSQRQLRNIAEVLTAYPSATARIRVYPDVSTRGFNLKLAQRRANSIMRELIRIGVHKSRVTVQSNKTSRPTPSNVSEKGRAQNGRISLSVTENEN